MNNFQYQVGGSLHIDAPSYVEREADSQLFQALKDGELCYVFNCRQMGKSSLLVRTKYRLQQEGFKCATVDLSILGTEQVTPLQWYKGLISDLWLSFKGLEKGDLKTWWREREDISLPKRLVEFFEELLLVRFPNSNLVIFIDEIDSILGLDFSADDFFVLIRFCYNQRAINPEYQRINFALFGVVEPGHLIKDKTQTPFNIGRAIDLTGFSLEQAGPLERGLERNFNQPKTLLKQILAWTGGQPFLTQKLCDLVTKSSLEYREETIPVGELVKETLINRWETQDQPEHFRTIRDRLLRNRKRTGRILSLYQKVLLTTQHSNSGIAQNRGEQSRNAAYSSSPVTTDGSREQMELLLSGLVVRDAGLLKVKNRIYEQIFNLLWVKKQLAMLRPYSQSLDAWVVSNQLDKSRLLRGRALGDALNWVRGKSLSDMDYQFLAASEAADRYEVELRLTAERSQAVEARLHAEQEKSLTLRWLVGAISLGLLVAISLGLVAFSLYRQALTNEQLAKQQELKALISSSKAEYRANQRLDALVDAIRAKRLAQQMETINADVQVQIEEALQVSIYGALESNRFTGAESNVNAVTFSQDGQLLVSGSAETLKFWRRDGSLVKSVDFHDEPIYVMDFSSDGTRIAVGTIKGNIKILNPEGHFLKTLRGHDTAIWDLAFSADGQTLVTASQDGTIKVWVDDKLTKTIPVQRQAKLHAVDISSDGTLIVSGWTDGTVTYIDVDGKLLKSFKAHEGIIWNVALNPVSSELVTAGEDGTIRLWNGRGKLLKNLKSHTAPVWQIQFSVDGSLLISSSVDQTVKVWSQDGVLLRTLEGHESPVWGIAISHDNSTIASASLDQSIRLWRLENPLSKTIAIAGRVSAVSFSPDSEMLAIGSHDSTVQLWQNKDNKIRFLGQHKEGVVTLDFSPDGSSIISSGYDKSLKIWSREAELLNNLMGNEDIVTSVINLNNGMIASANMGGITKIWQQDGTLLHSVKAEQSFIFGGLDASPDRAWLAIAGNDHYLRTLEMGNYSLQSIATESSVDAVSFSPDGSLIATASSDGNLSLWGTDGRLQKTFATSPSNKYSTRVKFSPDGQMIATTSRDNVEIWGLDGTAIKTLFGHQGEVSTLDFSTDGKTLATGSFDKTIRLWNLEKILTLDSLSVACDWARDYLRTSSEVSEEDRELCDI